ncbi:hypothetical protein [Saccharothrix hoggarensis]|uniref:Secreted protein n=1 Tax=Saccharothrix hoggarensis TaxID=913853 RepID=A0ABW3QJB2_9PSEU
MRRNKQQARAVVALVLLGFVASLVTFLLGVDRSWAFVVAAAVGAVAVAVMVVTFRR